MLQTLFTAIRPMEGKMATSNTHSFPSNAFKMPPVPEPCPLPSLGSDEESFVVLGKSLSPDFDDTPSGEINFEPTGTTILEEAKQLINKELSQLGQLSLTQKAQDCDKVDEGPREQSVWRIEQKSNESLPKESINPFKSEMEDSTVLPKMPHVEKVFETANAISIATFPTDLTSEEVQNKITQIIEENIQLKDTILKNNMSMKSQYERIMAWQEDVKEVHQTHKEKIIEATQFIERLKKEHSNLNRELEKLKEINAKQDKELADVKNTLKDKERRTNEKLVQSTDNNIKEFELDMANKKVRELETALQSALSENENLKTDKDTLRGNVVKMEEYEKEIERLQREVDSGKLEIEKAQTNLLQFQSLEGQKQTYLTDELATVKQQLYFVTQQKTQLPSLEEVNNLRQQLVNTQVMLTQVEHSRCAAYAQLEVLGKELGDLRRHVGERQGERDEIFALQTQLEVYKADFEAERNAKETMKTEKDKLFEDLQNLQRRNQQLQEEIEAVRNPDFVFYPSIRSDMSRRGTPSVSSGSTASSNAHPMKCPKCSFGFTTLQALEKHVYRCIELDDHLP